MRGLAATCVPAPIIADQGFEVAWFFTAGSAPIPPGRGGLGPSGAVDLNLSGRGGRARKAGGSIAGIVVPHGVGGARDGVLEGAAAGRGGGVDLSFHLCSEGFTLAPKLQLGRQRTRHSNLFCAYVVCALILENAVSRMWTVPYLNLNLGLGAGSGPRRKVPCSFRQGSHTNHRYSYRCHSWC